MTKARILLVATAIRNAQDPGAIVDAIHLGQVIGLTREQLLRAARLSR